MRVGGCSGWLGFGIVVALAGCSADEYARTHPEEATSSGGAESSDGSAGPGSGGFSPSGMRGTGGMGGGGRGARPEAGLPDASTDAHPSGVRGSPRDAGRSNDANGSSRDAGGDGFLHDAGLGADAHVTPEPADASADAPSNPRGRLGIDVRSTSQIGLEAESLGAGTVFAAFRDVITAHGYALVPLSSFTARSLRGVDAVILGMPTTSPPGTEFTATEIADLGSFVHAGHGVFLSADAGGSRSTDNVNALAAQWGVTFSGEASGNSAGGEVFTGLPVHPLTEGVTAFAVDYYQPMVQVVAPASVVVFPVLAAISGVNGSGNVVIMADQSMWMVPPDDEGLDSVDNRKLLANILRFVAPL